MIDMGMKRFDEVARSLGHTIHVSKYVPVTMLWLSRDLLFLPYYSFTIPFPSFDSYDTWRFTG
jgi:hypothetical protein